MIWVGSEQTFQALKHNPRRLLRAVYRHRGRWPAIYIVAARWRSISTFAVLVAVAVGPPAALFAAFGADLARLLAVAMTAGAVAGAVAGACTPSRSERAMVEPHARPALAPGGGWEVRGPYCPASARCECCPPPRGRVGWQRLTAGRWGSDAVTASARVVSCDYWDWWLCAGVAMFCAAPVELALEEAGSELRPHRAEGPAVRWPDGTVEYWWHGTRVPAGVLAGQWSARHIAALGNTEARRAAIEILGWPEFIRGAGLQLVDAAPDPGNPGHELRLYDLPAGFTTGPARLLLMTNGSPDQNGRDRVYAETVPASLADAVAAAAWQYDVPVAAYRQLQRRT